MGYWRDHIYGTSDSDQVRCNKKLAINIKMQEFINTEIAKLMNNKKIDFAYKTELYEALKSSIEDYNMYADRPDRLFKAIKLWKNRWLFMYGMRVKKTDINSGDFYDTLEILIRFNDHKRGSYRFTISAPVDCVLDDSGLIPCLNIFLEDVEYYTAPPDGIRGHFTFEEVEIIRYIIMDYKD